MLDPGTGQVVHAMEYRTPEALQAPGQKMQFTGFAWDGPRLYVCCHNEIVWFEDWPPTEPAGRLTSPGFNDLHHCLPWEGGLLVANTGLETVDHVALDGELVARWDLLEDEPGARVIDPAFEYRLLDDRALKPHTAHGNHVFTGAGGLWVTQLRTARLACLTDDQEPVRFGFGMPHDGRPIRDRLAFTTTNGHVAFVAPETMEIEAVHNLPGMTPSASFLGWCRGICPDPRSPTRYWVSFTYPRDTRWREYAFWAKYRHRPLPTRIASYDLEQGRMYESHEVTPEQKLVIFQLEVLDEGRTL